MASGRINKIAVDALVPGARDTFLWDDQLRGFGVKITPKGSRSYLFQYRTGGRESATRRYTIGTHGSPWTPANARHEAEKLALLVKQGIDPSARAHEQRKLAVDLAFNAYAQRFAASCPGLGWRAMVERTIRLYLAPSFKSKPVHQITRSQVAALLDGLPPGQLALRRNTFAVVRRLFRWAIARGDLQRSPCDGMETPRAVTPRDRVMTDAEVVRIWSASFSLATVLGPIVRLLLSTGQRREEVTGLVWSELDQERSMWTLPRERAKNGTTHTVPLSTLACSIISRQAARPVWPREGLVFPTSAGTRFTGHAAAKRKLDEKLTRMDVPMLPWRLHDLRRTVATGLQRLGVRFEVTEAVLNHLSGSRAGIAAIYQRHSWDNEKREALEAWASHLMIIGVTPI